MDKLDKISTSYSTVSKEMNPSNATIVVEETNMERSWLVPYRR